MIKLRLGNLISKLKDGDKTKNIQGKIIKVNTLFLKPYLENMPSITHLGHTRISFDFLFLQIAISFITLAFFFLLLP